GSNATGVAVPQRQGQGNAATERLPHISAGFLALEDEPDVDIRYPLRLCQSDLAQGSFKSRRAATQIRALLQRLLAQGRRRKRRGRRVQRATDRHWGLR